MGGTILSKPSEVFKPGLNEPNDMYVKRVGLEQQLEQTFTDDRVTVLLGASGSGKSWLYKRCFDDLEVEKSIIPISRSTQASLKNEFNMKLTELGKMRLATRSKANRWGIFGKILGFDRTTSKTEERRDEDPLLELVRTLKENAGDKPTCIVIENAEQGLENPKFLTELSDTIVSMNEAPLVGYGVKLLIVSADDSIRRKLQRLPNSEPVMRRLRVLPEVSSFTEQEATEFIERGFEQKLGFKVAQKPKLVRACNAATDFKPDYLHDYCLKVATFASLSEARVTTNVINQADAEWVETRLAPYTERIVSQMNENDTRKRVRDKVLFTLSLVPGGETMTVQNVLDLVRQQFGGISFKKAEVTRALNQLATRSLDRSEPILRKTGSNNNPTFSFRGPMERVSCRFILDRKGDEVVRVR
jgi:hypothetical protein